MCGIAGAVSLTEQRPDPAAVQRMIDRLSHRGPDDDGCATLGRAIIGMRRLSILDPTPRGHQPMTSADGRYTLVHNGEIYNFLELADELRDLGHRFVTESDTEVILAAYASWGRDCLARFNGIWAFAIWDRDEEILFLARDRFGVKPLLLAERDGQLAFASEIKALRTLGWVSADPHLDAIADYLVDGTVDHLAGTFFRDVTHFPAAHSLTISRSGRHWHRYWDRPILSTDASFDPQPEDGDRIGAFRSLLIDSVGLQLRSDVSIGSCLSGGIDSSSIVSIAAGLRSGRLTTPTSAHRERDGIPQMAFFAQFREAAIDERPYVDAVVESTGVTLHTTTPDADLFLSSLDGVMEAQDEPFGSLSIVAQYHVMRIANEAGVKVLLDGQGADELLAGYPNYRGIRLAGGLRSPHPGQVLDAARASIRAGAPARSAIGYALMGSRRLPARLIRGRLPSQWFGGALSEVRRDSDGMEGRGTLLARKLWSDVARDNLPGLLRYEDRNSMAFGIEARVPFLDHRLAEAALALPDRLKIDARGRRKIALHRAMRGIVPDMVLARRDKVAFQPPQDRWLRESRRVWDGLAADSRAERDGLLARGSIKEALAAFESGGIGGNAMWRALNLEMWLRRS
jgi:asparagine synthase (glutamine-hydrolysing)